MYVEKIGEPGDEASNRVHVGVGVFVHLTWSVYCTVGIELKKPGAEPKVFVPAKEVTTGYTVEQLQFLLGLALVLGFIFMLFIDQCGGGHSHNHSSASSKEKGATNLASFPGSPFPFS